MMHRTSSRVLLIVAAFVLFLVPVAAIAAGGFTDVEEDSVFKTDIAWLADAGVTRGCNPPTNDRFCPGSNVTREQMAAFMHRLAVNKVVDAKTAVTADNATNATNADKLDGKDSTAFLGKTAKAADSDKLDGKDSTAFMTKAAYDADTDGIVDSAEVVFRYAYDGFYVDVAGVVDDAMECETEPVTFDGLTTIIATGGLSLEPLAASVMPIYGEVVFRYDGETNWWVLPSSEIKAMPSGSGGMGAAAVPVNTTFRLDAGAYVFAIYARGQNVQASEVDYYGSCVLTVTAYTGLGASADLAATGITSMEARAGS